MRPVKTSLQTLGPEAAGLFAALHARCFADPWDEAAMASLLGSPGVTGLVIEAAGAPAGLILVRTAAGEAEILTLGVDPEARRAGLGAALLDAALDTARADQCETVFLEVSEANAAAAALYASAGFAETGRRARYYPDGSDARLLARAL